MLLLMRELEKEKDDLLEQLSHLQKKIKLLKSLKGERQTKELIEASSSLKQVKKSVTKMSEKKLNISKMMDKMIENE